MTRSDPSGHFDGTRFCNPGRVGQRGFPSFLRMALAERGNWRKWPSSVPVIPRQPLSLTQASDTIVSFVGHATFLIQTSAGNILTDPVYAQRASPVSWLGPQRVRQPGIRFADLPPIDMVLVSHNHYDHCDVATLGRLVQACDPLFITPLGNGGLLRRAGATRLVELDWWEPISQGEANVLLTPAQHFSARGVHDRNRALWGSFVVETPHIRLYFGVDSGYADHFREIGQRCGAPDVALLPIGAYEPRWFMRDMHMNPAEAVQTHLDLEARLSIAMHFGTFPLTIEGIEEPVGTLREELARRQIPDAEFRVLECGESLRMPGTSRPPASIPASMAQEN